MQRFDLSPPPVVQKTPNLVVLLKLGNFVTYGVCCL